MSLFPHGMGFALDAFHLVIVVFWGMMKYHQFFSIGLLAQPNAFLPGRMAPSYFAGKFFVGIGTVVDYAVGLVDESQYAFVSFSHRMLRVGYVTEGLPSKLDPVSCGAPRVIEWCCLELQIRAVGRESGSAFKVFNLQVGAQLGQWHRKHGPSHLSLEYRTKTSLIFEMPGTDRDVLPFFKQGTKKRKATDVVPMGVGEKDSNVIHAKLAQFLSKQTDSCSGIEHKVLAIGFNMKAAGVAPELKVVWSWAGNTPPGSPKRNGKLAHQIKVTAPRLKAKLVNLNRGFGRDPCTKPLKTAVLS